MNSMASETITLEFDGKKISGEWTRAVRPRAHVLLAHGAGARRDHPSMERLARSLAGSGFSAFLFNFPYSEAGRKVPDRTEVLVRTWMEVWNWAAARSEVPERPLLAGGRSMGGRMASMAAARHPDGFTPAGLVFFAYPLHAPGRTDKLRAAHLASIRVPMLFLSGTRDSMARRDLLDAEAKKLGRKAVVHWLEGADHGFHVLKRSGRTDDEVRAESARVLADWCDTKVGA